MDMARINGITLHWRQDGSSNGAPLVFANALGTDLRIWDKVVARLPPGLRIIRYDKRGHGLSDVPPAPCTMDTLIEDAGLLLDHLGVTDCVFVGLSIGGMIAQGLAEWRPDLVRGLVLSNTAARIGTAAMWADRIETVRRGGIEALAEPTLERWFPEPFRALPEIAAWRNMLIRTPLAGYLGAMEAIASADMFSQTAMLRLPALGIAGGHDGSTPADMVRETVGMIPGSRFHLIRSAGHLPCVDAPDAYASALSEFLVRIGHFPSDTSLA